MHQSTTKVLWQRNKALIRLSVFLVGGRQRCMTQANCGYVEAKPGMQSKRQSGKIGNRWYHRSHSGRFGATARGHQVTVTETGPNKQEDRALILLESSFPLVFLVVSLLHCRSAPSLSLLPPVQLPQKSRRAPVRRKRGQMNPDFSAIGVNHKPKRESIREREKEVGRVALKQRTDRQVQVWPGLFPPHLICSFPLTMACRACLCSLFPWDVMRRKVQSLARSSRKLQSYIVTLFTQSPVPGSFFPSISSDRLPALTTCPCYFCR